MRAILTDYEKRILLSFAKTLLPPTEKLPDTVEDVNLVERIEAHLAYLSLNYRFIFRMALFVFNIAAIFYRGRCFVSLSEKTKTLYLEKWRDAPFYPLRLLYKLLDSTCYMNYYAAPAVYHRLGYEPPPAKHARVLPRHFDGPDKDIFIKADVCVIGSGAGGAVVAKELSEKGRSVVLLEEGSYFSVNDFGKEGLESVQKIYHNAGAQLTLGAPCIILPTGKAVGGTTVINSGTCFHLPEKVYERWQKEFGLKDITLSNLKPYFDQVEKQLHVVPVEDSVLGNNARIFKRGLEKLGLCGAPIPRNVKDCQGAGMCCFGCPNDAKQSVQLSYIPQAIQNGAKLFVNCRVDKIIPRQEHGGEVYGSFVDPKTGVPTNRKIHVDAGVVVIAAGTLNTPYLLHKNRIASSNSHIGKHLTIHPTGKIIGVFNEEVKGWQGVPQGYYYNGMASEGIMYEGIFTPPSLGSFNLELPPYAHKKIMENYSHLASFAFLMSDEARGWIRWLPNGDPIIYYSFHQRELKNYFKAVRFLTEVFLAAGAQEIFTSLHPLPRVTPEMGLAAFDSIKVKRTDLSVSAFHPLGTCRMGTDISNSVVNSVGEVHGVKNLFIADGSVFPSSLGVNPQLTIMAFAARTAQFIDERIRENSLTRRA